MIRNALGTRPWQHVHDRISGYLTLVEKLYCSGNEYAKAGILDQMIKMLNPWVRFSIY
jgi:hypothetical protein